MTAAGTEVRVVCQHGTVATFVASSVPGAWIIRTRHANRATYPDGAQRWHQPMECRRCRFTAPAVNPDTYGAVLEWVLAKDRPGITRVSPSAVEVPLIVMARALGASHDLPE